MSLVDITSHKQNEDYLCQAVAGRHQHESFNDTFTHELLNPFSATLQCTDAIQAGAKLHRARRRRCAPGVDELIDLAQATLMCLRHQKGIIDDVLAPSKLKPLTMAVVPARVRLHESVAQTVCIFRLELRAKGIDLCARHRALLSRPGYQLGNGRPLALYGTSPDW